MATILLIVIYIAFIGLGIPDSVFGTAWPAIYREFDLPISYANYVTFTISLFTFISSLVSARLINKFGTKWVTAVSTFMTAAALFGFAASGNYIFLCLFSLPLGFGAGTIDTALNGYVAMHYKASHMNFLHCFYGVGITLSPYLMSFVMKNGSWRSGYSLMALIQLAIAAVMFISIPIWSKVGQKDIAQEEENIKTLSYLQLCRIPCLPLMWVIFFASCALEFLVGVWGSTYLVDHIGLSVDIAAKTISFYYVGIALGRFLSGVVSEKLSSMKIVIIGQAAIFAAALVLLLTKNMLFAGIGLFLIGFGNGPLFPNLIHITPKLFGNDIAQSAMSSQMTFSYLGILLAPAVFGWIAEKAGVGLFAPIMALLFVLMAVMVLLLAAKRKDILK